MSFGRLAVATAGVVSFTLAANAFEVRTFQYDVPNQSTFPSTWPPTDFQVGSFPNFFGGWNTSLDAVDMQIASPGLQIPRLEQMFSLASVPEHLQGTLLSVSIRLQGYVYLNYIVDNEGPAAAVATLDLSGTIAAKALTETPPNTFPGGADVLTVLVSQDDVVTPSVGIDNDGTPDYTGSDSFSSFISGQGSATDSYVSGDTEFDYFNNNSGLGFVYLPISFSSPAASSTTGNFFVRQNPFGSALVTVTYTFLPESDYLFGALPAVFVGWVMRRRLVSR